MNLEQARQLIGKYIEIIQLSPPFGTMPQLEYKHEGIVHEVVINGNVEGLRLYSEHGGVIPLKMIARYRVYEPGEWKQ